MLENWTFGRKLAAGFATAALTTLLIALLGFQSADRLIETDKWVTHTYRVRSELALLLALITEAETGQRGFIVTGREDFLEPYVVSTPKVERVFHSLQSQTNDNEQQQSRLRALKPLIDEKLTLLKENVERRRQQGFEAAHAVMLRGEGKRAMDNIRRLIEELDTHERTLLTQRSQQAEESTRWTKGVILWGSLAGLLFIIVVATLISRSLAEQVGSAVREIQTSSTELQAAANQQLTGAKEHATAMSEISTTIRELLATSRQIAQSAQRVVQIAEETATFARSGDSTVVRGQDATAGIQRQVDLIVSHMLELGKKSQQIGSVLDIVSELAEQTNILAINATIEAAGAGESGKRFAVVAEEIRKLADRVGRSTKEIRTLINDIQSAVNTTVMSTETGSKAVDSGTRQFAEVAAAFRQIAGLVSTTTDAAREIELSTKQQTTAVEQVNIAITSAAQATKESETSSSQTLQTASQLSQLSNGLLRIVEPRGGSRRNGVARI